MDAAMSRRLAGLRRGRGLSQEELAAAVGVSRQAVSKWERAECAPDTDNLVALARFYGASLDDIVALDSESPLDVPVDERSADSGAPAMYRPTKDASDKQGAVMSGTAIGRLALLLGLAGCIAAAVSAYASLPHWFDWGFQAGVAGRVWSFFSLLIVSPSFLMGVLAILGGVVILNGHSNNSPDSRADCSA